jgi:peptidoglycan/xylan/chitin deacetylase (PgdA/CDA1 family)
MTARAHPELVQPIVERAHERACHGDRHVLVFGQSCCVFETDVSPSLRDHRGVHRQAAGGPLGAYLRRERGGRTAAGWS